MKRFLFPILIFILLLCGCGKGSAGEGAQKTYKAKIYSVGEGLQIDMNSLSLINGKAYFSVGSIGDPSSIYSFDPVKGSLKCIIGEAGEDPSDISGICCFAQCEDGSLGIIRRDADKLSLQIRDKTYETLSAATPLYTYSSDNVFYPGKVLFTEGKTILIARELYCIDENGSVKQASVKGGAGIDDAVLTKAGRVFVHVPGDKELREYDIENNRLNTLGYTGNRYFVGISGSRSSDCFFAFTDGELYRIDPGEKKTEKILEWQSVNIQGKNVCRVEEINGEFRCIIYDFATGSCEMAVIKELAPGEVADERIEIVLASCAPSGQLQKAVNEYNKTSTEYKVTVKTYQSGEYILTTEDKNQIMRDILAKNAPDIIDLCGFERYSPSYYDMIDKGYVENLTPYFEKSDKLSIDDFLEESVAMFNRDGYLCAISDVFTVGCLLADGNVVPGDTITVSELIDLDSDNPEYHLSEYNSEYLVLNWCIYQNLDSLVDFESGTCDFDTEMFRKIMAYSKQYAGKDTASDGNASGKVIFESFGIDELREVMTKLRYRFEGKAVICGYPSLDGSFRAEINTLNGCALSIAGNSDHKEAAWDFIEYYLCREPIETYVNSGGKTQIMNYGIPSRKDALENYLDILAGENGPLNTIYYVQYGSGTEPLEVEAHPLTEEEREKIMYYIHKAQPSDLRLFPVYSIIIDEATAYFDGQKTLDEVIALINKRANLYLAERR